MDDHKCVTGVGGTGDAVSDAAGSDVGIEILEDTAGLMENCKALNINFLRWPF